MSKTERGPKTIFEQQLNVSTADRQAAQEAFNYAKTLERNGQGPAAEDQRQKARQILGLGLTTGLAHGEESDVTHKKGKTAGGTEYFSVEANASNNSNLPPQFKRDHRKAIAMTARGSLDSNPQLLKTASNLFADNAIKVVKSIGRGIGKVVSITWNLTKKGIEAQKAAKMYREREKAMIEMKMSELEKNSHITPLPDSVKKAAQKVTDREHNRYVNRLEEISESRVVTVKKYKGGKQIIEIAHEEDPPPWS